MNWTVRRAAIWPVIGPALFTFGAADASVRLPVNLSHYSPACGVTIRHAGDRLTARWLMQRGEYGSVALDLRPGRPLIAALGIATSAGGPAVPVLHDVEPVTFLTAGTRVAPAGRPPTMSIWNEFFDKPATRPHQTYRSRLDRRWARVSSAGHRASIGLGDLAIGPFAGELRFTFFAGSRLIRTEAVVATQEDQRAIIYDAGLVGEVPGWQNVAWMDAEGRMQRLHVDAAASDRALPVRHRTIVAETGRGSLACFPPPHQFFFPRDVTDNFGDAWVGRSHGGPADRFGIGVRQDPAGGGAFVPWFNAPPGSRQHLGIFYLLSRGPAAEALRETLRYTHGDRFPALPGYVTFTSHWHMAVAVTAMEQRARSASPLPVPDFVRVFKELGVNAVHLADFHGDGHQNDPGPLRLSELEAMFGECRRLSDRQCLLIPGEEVNTFLGLPAPGRHPGHWMSLFPRPVYWTMQRAPDQPFAEMVPRRGTLYHVGSREDMVELLKREHGLAWTAHPRIKASSWTPDVFRREPFYQADFWLGAAWKAMPADLSRPRLGERALDVLSDMDNWGQKKYMPGEVDVFKIDHTHELYGHMNINYLRLDHLPRFEDGWRPILDTLRGGQFFVTTGEVLIPRFTVGGKESGETLELKPGVRSEAQVTLEWTFPLSFAELVSGDGQRVYRERIDLSDTGPFGRRTLTLRPDLRGRKWVRFEVWDAATDGAFTQPVWLAATE